MANLLIVAEDIVKIQTFSGRLGRTYSKIYQEFLNIKLKLIIARYRSRNQITLLASDNFRFKAIKTLNYDQELARDRLIELKPLAWQIIDKISQKITKVDKKFCQIKSISLIKLWENKLAVRLIYDYLIYLALIKRLLGSGKFDAIIILDQSLQSNLACYYAKKFNLKLINYSWPNLNYITHWLIRYFRYRELNSKIKQFIGLAENFKSKVLIPKNSIFLSADFFRHLSTLSPVYKYLKQKNLNPCFIGSFSTLPHYLTHFNLKNPDYCFLSNFLPDKTLEKLPLWKKSVRRIFRRMLKLSNRPPENLSALLFNLFSQEFLPIIKYGLILSKLYLVAGDNFFKKNQPKGIVVVANTRLLELTLALLAKQYKKFSLMVSHRTVMFPGEPYRYDEVDAISVAGNHSKDQLIKNGITASNISVDGDPRFEDWQPSKETVYKRLKIKDLSKKIILLISFRSNQQIPPEEKKKYIQLTQAAVERLDNAILVIKPHPTEKKYKLEEELKKWQIDNVLISDNNQLELFNLLSVASVVIQTWSMTGLEAIMINRPVIIVNPSGKNYDKFIPYIAGGGAKEVKNINQLFDLLKIYIDKDHPETKKYLMTAKKFAASYIEIPDGKVCQRISNHFN